MDTGTQTHVQTHHFQTFAKSLSFQRFQLGKPSTQVPSSSHHDEMVCRLGPGWCPWFLWSNHPNYTPPLHILLVDDKWVQYTWGLARTISFHTANRSFQHPKEASSNHLLKNYQEIVQVSAHFGCWWGIGGNDFFVWIRKSYKSQLLVLHIACFQCIKSFRSPEKSHPSPDMESSQLHKNQHENSLSLTIFCWDDLMIFQKSPPFHGFLRFFNRKKIVLPNGQISLLQTRPILPQCERSSFFGCLGPSQGFNS